MAARDADALLLQVSADIRGLQKQFDKAVNVVNSGSKTMEDRATKFAKTFGNANDNAISKFSNGLGKAAGDSISNLAQNAGQATTVLEGFGAAGIAAAAGVGALMVLFSQARQAVAFGDAIADSAAKVGVSTDTLQEYRYAIHQLGGDYDDADDALSKFTQTLGKAELGFSQKALKPFAALGLSQEDLKNFRSADEALQVILERLAGIRDESQRQGLAVALGLEKFIPLAREGAGRLEELREAAHRLGYVMDAELVAKAGEANDKLEDLEAITSVQLKSAFIDLAPVVLNVAGVIATAAREVNKIAGDFEAALPVLQKWFSWLDRANKVALNASPLGQVKKGLGGLGSALDAAANAGRLDKLRESLPTSSSMRAFAAGAKVEVPVGLRPVAKPADFDPVDLSGGGGSASRSARSRSAEQRAADDGRLSGGVRDIEVLKVDSVEFAEPVDTFVPRGGLADLTKDGGDDFQSAETRIAELDASLRGLWDRQYDGLYDATYGALDAAFRQGPKGVLRYFLQSVEQGLMHSISKAIASGGAQSTNPFIQAAASFFGFSGGGYLGAFANGGGLLAGPGTGTSDSILASNGKGKFARFSDGEFIVNADATRRNRDLLEAINSGQIGRFAQGGFPAGVPAFASLAGRSGPSVSATFAPVLTVNGGDSEEVARLRAELQRMRASFQEDVTSAVNDGLQRRTIRAT